MALTSTPKLGKGIYGPPAPKLLGKGERLGITKIDTSENPSGNPANTPFTSIGLPTNPTRITLPKSVTGSFSLLGTPKAPSKGKTTIRKVAPTNQGGTTPGAGTGSGGGGGGGTTTGTGGTSTGTPPPDTGMNSTQLLQLINQASAGLSSADISKLTAAALAQAKGEINPQVNSLKITQRGLEQEAQQRANYIAQAGQASAKLLGSQLNNYSYANAGKDLAAIGGAYGSQLQGNQQGALNNIGDLVNAVGGSYSPTTTSGFNLATEPTTGAAAQAFKSSALPAEEFAREAAAQASSNHTLPLQLIGGARQSGLLTLGAGQQAAERIAPQITNELSTLPKLAQQNLHALISNANLTQTQKLNGLKLYLDQYNKGQVASQGWAKIDQGDQKLTLAQQAQNSLSNYRQEEADTARYRAHNPASLQLNPTNLANQLAYGTGRHTTSLKQPDGSTLASNTFSVPPVKDLGQAALIYAQQTGTPLNTALQLLASHSTKNNAWRAQYNAIINAQNGDAARKAIDARLKAAGLPTEAGTGNA